MHIILLIDENLNHYSTGLFPQIFLLWLSNYLGTIFNHKIIEKQD